MKKRPAVAFFLSVCLAAGQGNELVFADTSMAINRKPIEEELTVTAEKATLHTGPGEAFTEVASAPKGTVLPVLGVAQDWAVVCLPSGEVAMIHMSQTRTTQLSTSQLPEGSDDVLPKLTPTAETAQVETLFAEANASRLVYGLSPFSWDERLNAAAALKAQDMAENGYFGHYSENYGTPFQMLKGLKIAYKNASESIAATQLPGENPHQALTAQPAHWSNLLSPRFTKMGVGVANSPEYGTIVVQLFVQN